MDKVIYTSPNKHVDADGDECFFKIRQVADDDCIVIFSLDGKIWDASEDDTMCASIYMEALLAERAKNEQSQAMEAFLSMKTSIEDHVGQTDERVTKKMIRNVVRHYVTETDPTVHHARKEIARPGCSGSSVSPEERLGREPRASSPPISS